MRWIAAAAALLVLAGCAPVEKKTITGPGASATIEKRGDRTRLSVSGTDEVVEIQPSEVMEQIAIPVYPGGRIVEGSQYCAVSKERGDRTYSARLDAPAGYEKVLKWYQEKLGAKAITASVIGKRTALVARTDRASRKTRSVMISSKRGSKESDVTLVLVVRGK